jgi:hypothetical protein
MLQRDNTMKKTIMIGILLMMPLAFAGIVSHSASEIDAGSPDFNSVTADDLNATQLAANRFTATGTVGIGTSTPNSAYALDISNSTTASVRILKTGAAGTPQLVIYNAGALVGALGNLGFGNPTDLTLYPNPASNVLIDPAGGASRVGVGTSSPDSKLHVVGAVCAEAADSGTCTPAAGDVRGTRLCIAGDCRNVWPAAGASLTEADVETYIVNDIGTGYVPRDNGTSFENSPIYTSSSVGNVGIGTAAPNARLEIVSAGTAIRTPYLDIHSDNAPTADRPYFRGTTTHVVLAPARTGGTIYMTYPGDLTSGTVDTRIQETLFITPTGAAGNGNVGIGTAAPTQKLSVNGQINMLGSWRLTNGNWGGDTFVPKRNAWDGVSNDNYGPIAAGHGYYYNGLQSGGGGGWEAGNGQLYVAGNSMLMGNVGIGTAAPTTTLDVRGSADFGGQVRATVNSGGQFTGRMATGWAAVDGELVSAPFLQAYGAMGYNSGGEWIGVYGSSNVGPAGKFSGEIVGQSTNNILNSGSSGSGSQTVLRKDANNAYIWPFGTGTSSNTVFIGGGAVTSFTVTGAKNFQIKHPSKEGMVLVHSTLEGPEIAVFYRGEAALEDGKATIRLPDYFEVLTIKENRTVLLTPKFESDEPISSLAASEVNDGKFTVRTIDERNPSQKFYWEVKAVRSDMPRLVVEKPDDTLKLEVP